MLKNLFKFTARWISDQHGSMLAMQNKHTAGSHRRGASLFYGLGEIS
jgi:hypothetical protein